MRNFNKIAKENNLSRRTHSFNRDKDGYLTVTTEISTLDNVPRSEVYQHFFKCSKDETNVHIQMAREISTEDFLDLKPEVEAAETSETPAPMAEEKPKRKRAPRRKKVEAETETETPAVTEAPIHIAPEMSAPEEDDGLGLGALDEEPVETFQTYEKGNKVHGQCLSALLVKAYGADWQKNEKVKIIVRGLVAAIKDVVPVVDGNGKMLATFPVFVAEYLKKAA